MLFIKVISAFHLGEKLYILIFQKVELSDKRFVDMELRFD